MKRALLAVACFLAGQAWADAQENNWPQFRGPRGDGTTPNASLPLRWSETQNVKWKTAIHGRAWSSPVVWGRQVWLTTATEDGTQLFAVCVDAETGNLKYNLKLFDIERPQFADRFNTYASPTPVVEEGRVYVTFGSPGIACLDTQTGRKLWERRDFVCNHFRGAGSSPILHGGLFIMNFDGSDRQYVAALDKLTGRTVWQRERSMDYRDLGPDGKPAVDGDLRKAFATCHVAELDGKPFLLSQGAKAMYAYEPLTGDELWRVEERQNHSGSGRPVAGEGLVYVTSGWANGQVLAIRPGHKGEVVDANVGGNSGNQLQVVWKSKRNTPKKPSLLLNDGLLFGIDDNGVATCWDARTGATQWNERVGGNHSASPLMGAGRIYFFSEEGRSVVIEEGRQFKKIAENTIPGGFMASPAVTGAALILRTKTHLYRIEE